MEADYFLKGSARSQLYEKRRHAFAPLQLLICFEDFPIVLRINDVPKKLLFLYRCLPSFAPFLLLLPKIECPLEFSIREREIVSCCVEIMCKCVCYKCGIMDDRKFEVGS